MARVLTDEASLGDQSESLRKENRFFGWFAWLEIAVGGSFLTWGIYRYLTVDSYAWLIIGGIILGLGVSHHLKRKENVEDISKFESGKSGEEFVARLLREELPDDCYILNDLDVHDGLKNAQNDHVVLTHSGVFLVETKAYGGTLKGSADDDTWLQVKKQGGDTTKKRLTNPVQQNRYHRKVLERFFENHRLPFRDEDIHTYVAMVNKSCEWSIEGDDGTVGWAWHLPNRIKRRLGERRYTDQDLLGLLEALGVEPPDELTDTPGA